jgi:hypothetical protein
MRRFLFALLIVLLPLRGWMGDAMAYSMLGLGTNSHTSVNTDATYLAANNDHMTLTLASNPANTAPQSASSHPCHDAGAQDDTQANASPASSACTACQVCHLTVSLPQAPCTLTQTLSSAPIAQPPVLWASADLSVLTKPPVL